MGASRELGLSGGRVIPIRKGRANATKLGCGKETGRITGDLTEPLIPEDRWEMLREAKKRTWCSTPALSSGASSLLGR